MLLVHGLRRKKISGMYEISTGFRDVIDYSIGIIRVQFSKIDLVTYALLDLVLYVLISMLICGLQSRAPLNWTDQSFI